YAKSPNLDSRMDGVADKDIKSTFKEVRSLHRILLTKEDEWASYGQTLPTMTNDFHSMSIEAMIYFMRCLHDNHNMYAFFVGGGISSLPEKSVAEVGRHLKSVIMFASNQDLSKINNDITRLKELDRFEYREFENSYSKLGLRGYNFL